MSRDHLKLVWSNPQHQQAIGDFWLLFADTWIGAMNQFINYIDAVRGVWDGPDIIQGAQWVKKICLKDRLRVLYVVLDYNGVELASIPINFSISVPTQSLPRIASVRET